MEFASAFGQTFTTRFDPPAKPFGDVSVRENVSSFVARKTETAGTTPQTEGEAKRIAESQESEQSRAQGRDELSDEEKQRVSEMKQRDAEVHNHEQAHKRAGGAYAGLPHYDYERGPDGRFYAVSGEVKIDTAPEKSPEATIRKMEIVIRAALAPSDPSAQDRAVANEAKRVLAEAQAEVRRLKQEELGDLRQDKSDTLNPVVAGQAVSAYGKQTGVRSVTFAFGRIDDVS